MVKEVEQNRGREAAGRSLPATEPELTSREIKLDFSAGTPPTFCWRFSVPQAPSHEGEPPVCYFSPVTRSVKNLTRDGSTFPLPFLLALARKGV